MDIGIREIEFWEMTIAELDRAIMSWERNQKRIAQERAVYDYISASLIGRSIASYFSNGVTMPEIEEIYPTLFNDERQKKKEQQEELKAQLSALRFRQFANSYNKRMNNGGAN